MATNCATAGFLFGSGDLAAQYLARKMSLAGTSKHDDFDYKRALRLATYGVLVNGPLSCLWYGRFLDTAKFLALIGSRRAAWQITASKVVADEIMFAPVCATTFYLSVTAMEGRSAGECVEQLRAEFVPTMLTDFCFWPWIQAINFALIPPQFRILYISCGSLAWNSVLSFLQHHSSHNLLQWLGNEV